MDSAYYGPLVRFLKPWGVETTFDDLGVNSASISMHKFFGSPIPSGVVISSK
jgi:glutamate/tyrosine decarboxylase-like PLP-dependent enzyme